MKLVVPPVRRAWAAWLLCTTVLAAISCGAPALPTGPAVTTPEGGGGGKYQCKNVSGKTDPWLVEWDATQKARMQAAARKGVLLVRYSGCELEVLYGCEQPGKYDLEPTTLSTNTEYITSEDEVFAKLPVGAISLVGEFKQGDRWSLDYAILGMQQTAVNEVDRAQLKGECVRATHFVSATAIGAYRLVSEAQRKAAASVEVFGAGAGASTGGAAGALRQAGAYDRCVSAADASDAQCQAVVQLFLSPVFGTPPPPPPVHTGSAGGSEGPSAPGAGASSSADVQQPGTNLYWMRCPVGQNWSGLACTGDAKTMSWNAVKSACPSGYRLPTRQEFVDLLGGCDNDVTSGKPGYCKKCSKSGNCGSMFPSYTNWYWSSSSYADDVSYAWFVYFTYGNVYSIDKSDSYYARCVRGGPPAPGASAPGAAGGAEVQQPGTNLYWLRCPVGQTWSSSTCTRDAKRMDWSAAKSACPSGYRLPTRQEFVDLLGGCDSDVTSGNPGHCKMCSESGNCSGMFPSDTSWYWSSSSYADDVSYAWFVAFYGGGVGYIGKSSASGSARCVQGGP